LKKERRCRSFFIDCLFCFMIYCLLAFVANCLRARPAGLLLAALGCSLPAGQACPVSQSVRQAVDDVQPEASNQKSDALTANSRRAYAEVLKLRLGAARELLRPELASAPTAPAPLLVANCADFVELLCTQNASQYETLAASQEARLEALDKAPAGALRDYAQAEITLHLGLSQLLFKHLVVGGYHLRSGYRQMQDVAKHYPGFLPARKTLGICEFAVGSLPEGYHWLLRLLGLTANPAIGLQHLSQAAAQPNDFQTESQIYLAMIREGYYKKPEEALRLIERLCGQQPDNLLFAYLLISTNKRQHHGDAALTAYHARPTGPAYLAIPYLHHMAADLLLYRGDYSDSERENLAFLRDYKGQHYRKDAAFKLYLAAWLGGQPAANVARYRAMINQPGPSDIEEDNYAQHYYHEAVALNPILTRARLQSDGGYNQQALNTLRAFHAMPNTLWRDRIEAPYRRARAFQGLGQMDSAWFYFERTQTVAGPKAPYYFAPQAALQQGYMAQGAGNKPVARKYFQKALNYPWHEYKNSTDAKAKLALQELK
jgi:hypothetical protein